MFRLKRVFVLIAIFFSQREIYAQNTDGCVPENVDEEKVIKKTYETQRGEKSLPAYYSLTAYAPPAGFQGDMGTCTSWASAYAGLTIVKRIETGDMNLTPFSALDLHNRVKTKNNEDPCTGGNQISQSLQMLKELGCDSFDLSKKECKKQFALKKYDEKLYRYDNLTIDANDLKSALYYDQAPIVICMKSFTNGWNSMQNLKDGVWNGQYEAFKNGYHAMCIIGYDDTKSGGAFLVMNSWGKNWGKNGMFWLCYKDLSNIKTAYSMSPKKNKNTSETKRINNVGTFRVYNQCSLTSYVACAQRIDGYWQTKGWYPVQTGSYMDIDISQRDAREIYWMATGEKNKIWWKSNDSSTGKLFCFDSLTTFSFFDNDNCESKKLFFYFDPEFAGGNITSKTLSCDNYFATRGDEETAPVMGEMNGFQMDSRSADTANLYWRTGYMLFDYLTGSVISPYEDETHQLQYEVWYADKQHEIKKIRCNPSELEKLQYFKFISRENAEEWLRIQH